MKVLSSTIAQALVASAFGSSYSSYSYYSSVASFSESLYSGEDGSAIECGGTITGEQTIVSPKSGDFYYEGLNCVWNVELDPSVVSFDLYARKFMVEDEDCAFDRLQVIDADGDEVNYCGFVDPYAGRSLRRKRDVKAKKGLSPRAGDTVVNPVNTGLTSTTLAGNTATITFKTDWTANYKGFEIDITNIVYGEAPAPTPADAWAQIEAAATDVAVRVDDFYAALPGLSPKSVLAKKKVARFNAFFAKMQRLNSMSSADACEYPAGSNDHDAFVAPVDSDDACEELQGLFTSLASFLDSFVCVPTAEHTGIKLRRLIQRQRTMIVTRKLKQMKCGNFS